MIKTLIEPYCCAYDIRNKKAAVISVPCYSLSLSLSLSLLASRAKSNKAAGPRDRRNEVKDTTGGKRGNLTRNVGRSLAD